LARAEKRASKLIVANGIAQGKRDDLTGGGLVRSTGEWRELASAREAGIFLKSDERILGDSDFVYDVLSVFEAEELEKNCHYHQLNIDLVKLISVAAKVLKIKEDDVCTRDKQPHQVRARSLLCYWAVRELGITATALAKTLGLSQPDVTQCVRRGEKVATDNGWHLPELPGE
jgi:putative transposase